MPASFPVLRRLCVLAAVLAVASACTPPPAPPQPLAPKPEAPPAPHQLTTEAPNFFRLPDMSAQRTPVRVGVILPFNDASPNVRALASAMMKAAELALFDSGNRDILLMTADDNGTAADASAAAQRLLDQGAEIIIGPLFSASVSAVAPLARDRGVPVLAFSTDRNVGGDGVYLLSFQPQSEVERVVDFAAAKGHKVFSAMIPSTLYGDVVEKSFRQAVTGAGGTVSDVEHFNPQAGTVTDPAQAVAKSGSDAILIAQGGSLLRGIAPTLSYDGVNPAKTQFLGTGLWDDPANTREPLLAGGWFAAPQPSIDAAFLDKYRSTFGVVPPPLASLAYDAVSLVALLSQGQPYHRFTQKALTDPNGFAGVDGIFRFHDDGSIERGLAVLAVEPGGFTVIDPAPTTFQAHGS